MRTVQSETVLDFWFGSSADDAVVAREKQDLWWKADPANDAEIRRRFEPVVQAADRGELSAWAQTPRGLLALVLLTDQFPRNIYRGTARTFAFDAAARAHCKHGIARGFDQRLRPIERVFHYLPLEHSESPDDQEESVRLFAELESLVPADGRALFGEYLRYARRHRDIVARFGRFPHRNAILGRASRPEELAFLAEPGSSF